MIQSQSRLQPGTVLALDITAARRAQCETGQHEEAPRAALSDRHLVPIRFQASHRVGPLASIAKPQTAAYIRT
jgi:hypothetical protein